MIGKSERGKKNGNCLEEAAIRVSKHLAEFCIANFFSLFVCTERAGKTRQNNLNNCREWKNMQWGDIMRDRWYINVWVANVIKRLSSAAGASRQWEQQQWLWKEGSRRRRNEKKFQIPGFLSFAYGLWEFRQLSPCERFEWAVGDKESIL